ncbi:MAG: hypothetical protein SNJ57_16235 [Cyanobacteriota bacterium]
MAKAAKLARNLVQGDRVWLRPQSTLGWGFEEKFNIFTVSRIRKCFNGQGGRVLVYVKEKGDRPVAWLRGSTKVWKENHGSDQYS